MQRQPQHNNPPFAARWHWLSSQRMEEEEEFERAGMDLQRWLVDKSVPEPVSAAVAPTLFQNGYVYPSSLWNMSKGGAWRAGFQSTAMQPIIEQASAAIAKSGGDSSQFSTSSTRTRRTTTKTKRTTRSTSSTTRQLDSQSRGWDTEMVGQTYPRWSSSALYLGWIHSETNRRGYMEYQTTSHYLKTLSLWKQARMSIYWACNFGNLAQHIGQRKCCCHTSRFPSPGLGYCQTETFWCPSN